MKTVKQIIKSNSYANQLDSEPWKKFSRSIRSLRDVCECCRQKHGPLQVHHLFYDPQRQPWEYTNEEVMVLCKACHDGIHQELQSFRKYVFRYLNPSNFALLNASLAVGLTKYKPVIFVHAMAEFVANERLVDNHAKSYGFKNSKGDIK
jgi:hypothetical protein